MEIDPYKHTHAHTGILSTLRFAYKKMLLLFFTSAVSGQAYYDPSPYLKQARFTNSTKSCGQIGRPTNFTITKRNITTTKKSYKFKFVC